MSRALVLLIILFFGGWLASAPAQAAPVCLTPNWDNTFGYWTNACDFKVYVNWDDGASCRNFSCSGSISAKQRTPATLNRRNEINWCEFHNGKTGRCNQTGAAESKAEALSGATPASDGTNQNASVSSQPSARYGTCEGNSDAMADLDDLYIELGHMIRDPTIGALRRYVEYFGPGAPNNPTMIRRKATFERCS